MGRGADMAVVGFRCGTDGVRCVIMDGTRAHPVVLESRRLRFPVNLQWPGQLAWLRTEISQILQQLSPAAVCFKKAEAVASFSAGAVSRIEAEAIVQLAAHECGVECIRGTVKRTLKSDLGWDGAIRYVDRAIDDAPLAGLSRNCEEREAALAAWSSLPEA
jgi:hypothetical protein